MILRSRKKQNIANFTLLILPLIAVAKLVRWTIMKPQLVDMSSGWSMIKLLNFDSYLPFTPMGGIDNCLPFYDFINFFGVNTYVGWEIMISLIVNVVIFFSIRAYYKTHPFAGLLENIFIYFSIAILNIFCLNLSKEPYQLMLFGLMALAISVPKKPINKNIWLYVALLSTVVFGRNYYALVLVFLVGIQIVVPWFVSNNNTTTRRGRRKLYGKIFLLTAVFALMHFLLISFLSNNYIDIFNEMDRVNSRDWTEAPSEITPLFPMSGQPIIMTLEYLIKIFRLLFPIELIFKGKITYSFLVVYQLFLVYFIVRAFRLRSKENEKRTLALYLYLAFLLASATFEPDFGSWIRHQGVAFPVIMLIL